jgi:choline transport protein
MGKESEMMESKIPAEEVQEEGNWGGLSHDELDMTRLGKKQEFKVRRSSSSYSTCPYTISQRNFNFLSTLGFVSIYMATWEFVLVSLSAGFINGGFGGLFWTFIGTVICYSTIVASLAEMSSMSPTSGGQYHWVSEFAPPEHQKILSYMAGWMSTLGWLASLTSSVFVCATLIEVCAEVIDANFSFTNWQFTLLMLALLLITIGFNTVGASGLPALETASLFGHGAGFVIVVVVIWVMCPRNTPEVVFTSFIDSGDWGNIGVACMISQVTVMYCNLGSDSIVHICKSRDPHHSHHYANWAIAEEVEDASLVVPKAMWWSYVINVIMGIIVLISEYPQTSILFCLAVTLARRKNTRKQFTNRTITEAYWGITAWNFLIQCDSILVE